VDRWAGPPAVLAALLPERRPPAAVRTDPPRYACRHRHASIAELVEEIAVAELRVNTVGVEQGVGPVGPLKFGVG
jgi:hypothetical protein